MPRLAFGPAASPEANDALRRKPLQQIHLQCAVVSRNGEARPWQTQEMIEHQEESRNGIARSTPLMAAGNGRVWDFCQRYRIGRTKTYQLINASQA